MTRRKGTASPQSFPTEAPSDTCVLFGKKNGFTLLQREHLSFRLLPTRLLSTWELAGARGEAVPPSVSWGSLPPLELGQQES